MLTELGAKPPCLGVVLSTTQRDAQIRFRRGVRTVPLGQCVPVARADNMAFGSREGETFSHFLSLEFDNESEDFQQFREKVKDLQGKLGEVQGMGKPCKGESLHLTLAVLHVVEEEIPSLMEKIRETWEKFLDMLGMPSNLVLSFKGLEFGDRGSVWIRMNLGTEVIMVLRELIEANLGQWLTDLRFSSRITIFRSSEISDEKKRGLRGTAKEINLGCATVRKLSLRPRKVGKEKREPVLQVPFAE